MKLEQHHMGIIFALLAALSNASIGLFTNLSLGDHLQPIVIAFYRCLVALAVISICLFFGRNNLENLQVSLNGFLKISLCALFGIFILYFFETLSYRYSTVANVTFLLMGTSAILTFVIGRIVLTEIITVMKLISFTIVLAGIFLMVFNGNIHQQNIIGDIFAIIAGAGYSLFMLFTRKFHINTSLKNLWYFFLLGSVYLFIPFMAAHRNLLTLKVIPVILLLGIVPTLGGFYFTTKALLLIEASKAQMFEMSEPIFASLIALAILNQAISFQQIIGGLFILAGLFLSEFKYKNQRAMYN